MHGYMHIHIYMCVFVCVCNSALYKLDVIYNVM